MRAVRFHSVGSPDVLELEELPIPSPAPGTILVRVETAGINFSDAVRRRGAYYPAPTPLPFIPGGEVIGTVVELGSGVTDFAVGDRVFGNPGAGSYAEYVLVPAAKAFPAPAALDAVKGIALVIQGLTAALALRESGHLKGGDVVFAQGAAGGVGLLATQIARADGARLVIGGAGTPERRALSERHGAHRTVDYNASDWGKALKTASDGHGVDLVLEMSGGSVFTESLACLAPFGRMVIYGNASGERVTTMPQRLLGKNQSLTGFYLGGFMTNRPLIAETLADLADKVIDGRLQVHVGGVFSLDEVAEAHRMLEAREASGKLVLRVA